MKILCTKLAEQKTEWLLVDTKREHGWVFSQPAGDNRISVLEEGGKWKPTHEMKSVGNSSCTTESRAYTGNSGLPAFWKINTAMVKGNLSSGRRWEPEDRLMEDEYQTESEGGRPFMPPLSGRFSPPSGNLLLVWSTTGHQICASYSFLLPFSFCEFIQMHMKNNITIQVESGRKTGKHSVLQF